MLKLPEVAALLGIGLPTLKAWRQRGEGPPARTLGPKLVRFRRGDVLAWIAEQTDKGAR